MPEYLERAIATDLDVVGDGRTVTGMVAPYNRVAEVDDGFGPYLELFERGAFERVLRGRPRFVEVHLQHLGSWVGRGDVWNDGDDGLRLSMRLDDTEAGRTAAFKIRDGQTPGLSLGFVPGRSVTVVEDGREVVHRQTIKRVHHVALCPVGAYADARVEAVRSAVPERRHDRVDRWRSWTNDVRGS